MRFPRSIRAAAAPALAMALLAAPLGGGARAEEQDDSLPAPVDMTVRETDGVHMPAAMAKLVGAIRRPPKERPFLVWALGSSYTGKQGNGDVLIELIEERYPDAKIEYRRHVGNAVAYQFLTGWVRHVAAPENPDLIIVYALGDPEGLAMVLDEARRRCTADVIVPSLHLRKGALQGDGTPKEGEVESDLWTACAEVARLYGVEWVDNRREWAEYMAEHGISGFEFLQDSVHQNRKGARLNFCHVARHFAVPANPAYDPHERERRVEAEKAGAQWGDEITHTGAWRPLSPLDPAAPETAALAAEKTDAKIALRFTGDRVHLIGGTLAGGGKARVFIDGKPASESPAFSASYIRPDENNSQKGKNPKADAGPHGVDIHRNAIPQSWTITMLDGYKFKIEGSATGPDGEGDTQSDFLSNSGQVGVPTALWRPTRGEKRKREAGDKYYFDVVRSTLDTVDFGGEGRQPALFRAMLADNLPNEEHTLEIVPVGDGAVVVDAFEVFQPPLTGPSPARAKPAAEAPAKPIEIGGDLAVGFEKEEGWPTRDGFAGGRQATRLGLFLGSEANMAPASLARTGHGALCLNGTKDPNPGRPLSVQLPPVDKPVKVRLHAWVGVSAPTRPLYVYVNNNLGKGWERAGLLEIEKSSKGFRTPDYREYVLEIPESSYYDGVEIKLVREASEKDPKSWARGHMYIDDLAVETLASPNAASRPAGNAGPAGAKGFHLKEIGE